MADALELSDDDFDVDPSAPPGFRSAEGRTTLFTVVFVTAFILLIIQFIVPQLLAVSLMPAGTPSLFNLKIEMAKADQAVWWEDRLWVTVTTEVPGSPQVMALRAIKDDGTWDPDSDIKLAIPFDHAVVDRDRLLLITSTSVTTIQDHQVRTVYPRMALNQPSRPFLHEGQLCVLDRPLGQSDVVWYEHREGEWAERGRIAMPADYQAAFAARPTSILTTRTMRTRAAGPFPMAVLSGASDAPLAVVLPDGHVWVGTTLDVNGTPTLWSAIAPAEAFTITNQTNAPADALKLDDPAAFVVWNKSAAQLGQSYTLAVLDGEPVIISLAPSVGGTFPVSSRMQVQKWVAGERLVIHELAAFPLDQVNPVVKPDGTLVFLSTSPLSPMGLNLVELTAKGFGSVRRVGTSLMAGTPKSADWLSWVLMYTVPILTATILGLVAHVMVERHRDRRFSFGHHTVKLASIARRGVARVIDMLIFSAPAMIVGTLFYADLVEAIEEKMNAGDFGTLLFWGLSLALGFLIYLIVETIFFGTLEGVWGASPGKWVMGLRVVRTTFRPIGILRGLIRQFLLLIDGQFNYFVAILMTACLAKSQRLGDLCADSIVVELRSLPPNWRNGDPGSPG